MKKCVLLFVLGVLLSLPCMASAEEYVNGIDANYPPFAYVDEKTGQPSGFDVDALNWIAKKMGFTVTHRPVAWDGIISALLAKQIDMVGSGMSITPKRAEMVAFSEPYWVVQRVFVAGKDSALTPADILSKKIHLGVQRGTSEADAIKEDQKEKGYPLVLHYYESAPLIVKDLLIGGRIDAALMDQLPADDAIAKGSAVKKIGEYGEPDNFGVAMRKGDTDLIAKINKGYELLKADPYWMELINKYLK